MIKLERLNKESLSYICKELSPVKYETIQKINKLLDGSYHIQTIGEPLKYLEFTVIARESQAEKINQLESIGEPVKIIDSQRLFIGYLGNKVDWKRLTIGYKDRNRRLYEGRITLIIKEGEVN